MLSASKSSFSAARVAGALLVTGAVAGAIWFLPGAAPRPVLTSQSCRDCNVLLVTIDTLRRDRVGVYGGRQGLTPTMDSLAAGGVRYDQAFSHAPMTLPAHASILTGLTPRRHGVRNNTTYRLDERVPTLATSLKQAGYRTGAFVAAFVLDARFGLNQGFDVYDDHLPRGEGPSFHFTERPADDVVQAAGDWIAPSTPAPGTPAPGTSAPGTPAPGTPAPATPHPSPITHHPAPRPPWLAWVHLFDPHAPYRAPVPYRDGRSAYDAEVAYADSALGRLLDRLRSAGELGRTVIVVTADHGESLGDHGETTHGLFAYDATIRVPLILNGPRIGPGVAGAPVGHDDILPTVLDLVGIAAPGNLEGRSLAAPPSLDRPIYFEAMDAAITRGWAPLRGVVQNGLKYIDLPETELYDLTSDPSEQHNLAGRVPRERALRQTLLQLNQAPAVASPSATLDADAAARLRSLGYVGGSAGLRQTPPTPADDPKRLVALNEQFNSALTAFDEGRAGDALRDFAAILSARPDFLSARTSAATVLIAQGRNAEAVGLLRAAPPDQQASAPLLTKLAAALRADGDLPAAIAALEAARRGGDERLDLLQDLAITYAAAGRLAEARALFADITRRHDSVPTAWYNLGLFEMQSERSADAASAFRRAVERDPAYAEAWQALGAVLARTDPPAAIEAWRRAERLMPGDFDLLFNLGVLSAEGPRPSEAIPYLRRFADQAPRDRYAGDIERVRQILSRLERAERR